MQEELSKGEASLDIGGEKVTLQPSMVTINKETKMVSSRYSYPPPSPLLCINPWFYLPSTPGFTFASTPGFTFLYSYRDGVSNSPPPTFRFAI